MSEPQPRRPILIVEDDRNIASLVEQYLQKDGFETLSAGDGDYGLALARRENPALVILDINLPGMDGWEVCRALRRDSDVPILMLTARAEEMDRVVGLSIGADDYVVKPFSPRELVERVKAILRRTTVRADPSAAVILESGPIRLDPERHAVTMNGADVSLTPSEFKLLQTMMQAPGKVFSRDELLDRLYDNGGVVVDRVIDVHMGKLRQKLEPDPSTPQFLLTVHGVGYRFADPNTP
jgi:DNA-binding response OmpR family regulator